MYKIFKFTFITVVCISLTACKSYDAEGVDELIKLRSYRNLSTYTVKKEKVNELRYMALRNAAMSLGARAGLSWRSKQVNEMLGENARELDRVFNFQPLVLSHNVLPPVLIEGRNTLNQHNGTTLKLADRTYTIINQARFVTTVPSWRDYLLTEYLEPEIPDRSLLPKTGDESDIWDYYVQDGWKAGILQAENIYTENLAKLKRDIEGMIRYQSLLEQNMVSAPFVAETKLGVTGDKSNMSVNNRILKITALPELKPNTNGDWKTEAVPVKS